jgi:hypothetical protein
MANPAN